MPERGVRTQAVVGLPPLSEQGLWRLDKMENNDILFAIIRIFCQLMEYAGGRKLIFTRSEPGCDSISALF